MAKRRGNPALVSVERSGRHGQAGRRISEGTKAEFSGFKRDLDRRLQAVGVHGLKPRNFGEKHVSAYVGSLRREVEAGERSIGTIKNDLSCLRAFVHVIGKDGLVPRTNGELGFGRRQYKPTESKAVALTDVHLERITDPYTRASLAFQSAFGFRRETALKIQPIVADKGDHLEIKGSAFKGRRSDQIVRVPIRTAYQREVLQQGKVLAAKTPHGSLIPTATYAQQLRRFEYQCRKAGLHGSHGLRHEYAQRRYLELTGWPCPLQGGPEKADMSPDERRLDHEARLTISKELSHERPEIVALYIG